MSIKNQKNAQFTYDKQPGNGILDDNITTTSPESVSTTISSPASVTYEALANYLDIELLQQQLSTQNFQLSLPPVTTIKNKTHPQLLLPKIAPAMAVEDIAKALFLSSSVSFDLMNIPNNPLLNVNDNKASKPSTSDSKPIERDPSEDKRRRNTAASARFRIKKKQREQSLEKNVRAMTEKSTGLENRVRELELEIKFLKGLLIEKDTSKPVRLVKIENNPKQEAS
jgi:hypothetical protein